MGSPDPRYGRTGKCVAPVIERDGPAFVLRCDNPEECLELFNETREDHHYGCECEDCVRDYWMLKQ